MKSKLLIIASAVFEFIACDDLGTTKIDTTLSKTLTVNVSESVQAGANFNSTDDAMYSFYEVDNIDLSENDDLNKYLDNIDEMEVYKVTCKLNGLSAGQVINELTVFSSTIGLSISLFNITEFNNAIELEVSAALLKKIGEHLLQYEELEVGVSGYVTVAPLVFTVELSFETKVKAGIL